MLIRKDTIIKPGDHLFEPNGEKWEVKTIEGKKFRVSNLKSKTQRIVSKDQMTIDPAWTLVIMDQRNYW